MHTQALLIAFLAATAAGTTTFPITFTHTVVVQPEGTAAGQPAHTTAVEIVHGVTISDDGDDGGKEGKGK